ncbi:hypothetical protein [Conchiformibius steedae]|uniref:hypothetical protein n=1 Tax=Conchiformibius steedae TaxID=153493 RepID=UPI0026EDC416|nr:hypothetical protein [Conchiformibius steedae]
MNTVPLSNKAAAAGFIQPKFCRKNKNTVCAKRRIQTITIKAILAKTRAKVQQIIGI